MATGVSLAPVYLVDASLYIFRAYHSVPLEWHDRDGWPTNAAQGFTSFLLQLLEHARPERVAICFDEALGLCYRNEIYPAYKANRDRPDEILVRQFTHCQNIARALGLTALSHPRYEADDLLPRRPELDTVRSLFVELGFGPFLRRRVEAIEARWHG